MNELHLFAGGGGGILGGMLLGHRPVCAVELIQSRREKLLLRQRDGCLPRFPIWDDICTFDGKPWRGIVDVVCGGFPCTDISVIKSDGKGIDGEKSGLWREMSRVVREVQPRYVFAENSPALLIRGFDTVLSDLAKLGYHAKWCVLGGGHLGFKTRRNRIWILGEHNAFDGAGNKKILTRADIKKYLWCSEPSGNISNTESSWLISNALATREIDGMAEWVDRFEACGNGQIPQVAAMAWKILSGLI